MTLLDQPHRGRRRARATGPAPPSCRRKLRGVTRGTVFNLLGAAAGRAHAARSCSPRLTALSGPLGFVIVAYVAFVVIYAVLVSLADDGPGRQGRGHDRADGHLTAVLALGRPGRGDRLHPRPRVGRPPVHLNFYTQDMSKAGPPPR